jgi:hypothetical protein
MLVAWSLRREELLMRNATQLLVLVGALTVPAGIMAKGRPQPVPCPTDVSAALAEACPCAGKMLPSGAVQPWKNHGQYVSCAVRFRNALRKSSCPMDAATRRTIARCAARSTCGKGSAVLCCFTKTGTCSDPTPDGVKAGRCSNDGELASDTPADCTMRRVRIAHDEARCLSDGGTSAGQGNVCTAACSPSGAFLDAAGF